jgi:flavoprotein
MNIKFGEHIRLDSPKPISIENDFSNAIVTKITSKAVIKAVEQIDDAILNEIVAMARSEGIDDIYLLDKKNIISALSKQIPKKVEKIKSGFKSFNYVCPECAYRQISQIEGEWIAGQHYNYCSNCGQALDWSDTNDR